MKNSICLGIATVTFVAGWGLGRHGGAGSDAADANASSPSARRTAPSPAEDRQNRELQARQTAEKIHDRPTEETAGIFTALDPAARGPALETWIASLGPGEMPTDDQDKLRALLDTWAQTDFEGARRWADGLKSNSIRQLALVGLAGAIATDDPQKAFECLISNGPFSRGIDNFRVQQLMTRLSNEAIAAGGDALLALWQRLPEGTEALSSRTFLNLGGDKGIDFHSAMDAYLSLQSEDHHWPLVPGDIMKRWAMQDPQAATDYLADSLTRQKPGTAFGELRNAIAEKEGRPAAKQWALDLFNSIPPGQLPDALRNSGYGTYPSSLLLQLPDDLSTADRARFMTSVIQNAVNDHRPLGEDDFTSIPAAERLNILSQLRGVTEPDAMLDQAKKAGASEAQLAELKQQITRPR